MKTTIQSNRQSAFKSICPFLVFLVIGLFFNVINAQFAHPGISHKKSDLDRMKYMVEAQIEPYYTSYQNMVSDGKSSYNYTVQGKSSYTELGRDSGVNYGAWNSDIRAAYYNAIRWYVTGDSRHADKAVEIFNAWSNLTKVTSNGTAALSGGVGYIMVEAAELIKSTYSGWSSSDIQRFSDMLVYPGYSNTQAPDNAWNNSTFYWSSYQGDSARHGNQGLSGWRTVMAMGIFLDNEIMYDRALRYIKGQSHRSDDLPYPSGPRTHSDLLATGEHADTYRSSQGNSIEDYGYNEVMTYYIYETGQCQESSRDQAHVLFGLGLLNSMAEMAWNQGDDLYSHEDNRLLLGLEYTLRYNVSSVASYSDQTSSWEPSSFLQGFDRTERWYSKSMSPDGRGDFTGNRPNWEMSTAHYIGRGFKTEDEAKWTKRARDKSIDIDGYEEAGWTNDAIGWGGLTFRRPAGCYGDPVTGIGGTPEYNMHVLPTTIEAENYDYSPVNGEGRTYHDTSGGNTGNAYRSDDVDIQITGGVNNVGWIANGEWLTYTIYVPETRVYDISVNYAATNSNGNIKFEFSGSDKTGEVTLPSTGSFTTWNSHVVKQGIALSKGVQSLKVLFSGAGSSFNLNSISVLDSSSCGSSIQLASQGVSQGINYSSYQGEWDSLPNFDNLTPVASGIVNSIDLNEAPSVDYFGFKFSGYMNVSSEGEYTFYTTSDDGSALWIDDVQVVNNDGLHGAAEKSGTICLETGYHKIEVTYFEKTGGSTLSVAYAGPGISKTTLSDLYNYSDDSNGGSCDWTTIANEGGALDFSGTKTIRYGANGVFVTQTVTGGSVCGNAIFGDPLPGVAKICQECIGDTNTTVFMPDPNKTYYIDAPIHNLRLAANGVSEFAYTMETGTTGADVEWKFVAKGNGSWHIQRAAGGTLERLRTDNTITDGTAADMQATSSSLTYTYFDFEEGALDGTYFITLPDGPTAYVRLQIDNSGNVQMVDIDHAGTWESFTITEAGGSSSAEDIRLEAEDYDAMYLIQTEGTTDTNGGGNVGWINNGDWIRFDDVNLSGLSNMDARIACNFTGGTIEVRTGSETGALIGSISITNTGGNQSWVTKNTNISNASGTQDVYLVFTGGSGYLFNVNWIEFNNSSTANKDVVTASAEETEVLIYPNPIDSSTTIQGAANSTVNIYDINGNLLLSQTISSESETLDFSLLTAAGIYYAKVNGEGKRAVIKLVKE